jgi:hypothetical protein
MNRNRRAGKPAKRARLRIRARLLFLKTRRSPGDHGAAAESE